MSLLGGALLGQGRYAEAEPLVVAGYEGMKAREARIAVPERSRLREAAERVVRLYEAWGKPEQAAAWKAKLGMPDLPADVFGGGNQVTKVGSQTRPRATSVFISTSSSLMHAVIACLNVFPRGHQHGGRTRR